MTSNDSTVRPTFAITGATGGIGLAVCEALVRRGVRLLAVVRCEARGREPEQRLTGLVPGTVIEPVIADLASLAAIREVAGPPLGLDLDLAEAL